MQVFHPHDAHHRSVLMHLLQTGLRPDGAPFPIAAEYPLVLGAGLEAYSYCLGTAAQPLAHAHLWPRRLKGGSLGDTVAIGLVGNVVTHEQYRGRGLAKELLEGLKQEAVRQGLRALVLWSDLTEFYQKCGFTSCGEERRWLIPVTTPARPAAKRAAKPRTGASIALCDRLMACRLSQWPTLVRSSQEFVELLRIPQVSLMTDGAAKDQITTFTIMGKGCDMLGVVHEWGAPDASALVDQVIAQGQWHGLSEVMLLTPSQLPGDWHEELRRQSTQVQRHPMALAWCLDSAAKAALDRSFIWGLDSI